MEKVTAPQGNSMGLFSCKSFQVEARSSAPVRVPHSQVRVSGRQDRPCLTVAALPVIAPKWVFSRCSSAWVLGGYTGMSVYLR